MFDHWFVRKWLAPLMVASAVAVLVLAVLLRDVEELPAVDLVIEQVIPGNGDEVLSQQAVTIDLIDGYTAELTINGTSIPESQLRRVDALNSVTFQPGEGNVIESLRPDVNCARALYWPLAQGRSAARSYEWCFGAS